MANLTFSLSNYQSGLSGGLYAPPTAMNPPYYDVDPVLYRQQGSTDQRRGDLTRAVGELRKRTDRAYFNKTYPLQARTLDHSSRAFPAYRFILPEVMTEDWLAIVDWGKFQRDHVLHQPLTGYVVLRLLDENHPEGVFELPEGKSLLNACVERILRWKETAYIKDFLLGCGMDRDDPILDAGSGVARNVWRAFFRETAYVAAVFHDLGYPWQYAERIQGNLDGMNTPAVRQNRSAEQVVRLFGHRMLFHVLQGYKEQNAATPSTWRDRTTGLTDSALKKTHGMPGALGFLHLNDCVRRFPSSTESPLHLLCVEWAAAAIMMHDMGKIYWGKGVPGTGIPENPFLRLSFDRDPLSALVTLADVLQDFARPVATFGQCGNGTKQVVSLDYDEACSSTELELKGTTMIIRYLMKSGGTLATKRKCLAGDLNTYFDPHHGYLDMASLGITNVELIAC